MSRQLAPILLYFRLISRSAGPTALIVVPLLPKANEMTRSHELLPFLAMWAVQYQRDYRLDGLHPTHYDLMVKYGARMNDFQRATNSLERDSGDGSGEAEGKAR